MDVTTKWDKYDFYTSTLQDPIREALFIASVAHGDYLREDFCGTAEIMRAWLALNALNTGVGIDIDPKVLERASQQVNECPVTRDNNRAALVLADSTTYSTPNIDIVLALNSSIFLLRDRDTIVNYFKRTYMDLAPGGHIIIDIFGGPEAHREGVEYIYSEHCKCEWEQRSFDPATNELIAIVHFIDRHGDTISNAFEYQMRIWSPAEIVDALSEAGFAECNVLIGRDRYHVLDGGQANTPKVAAADLDEWEAYIIASKNR